MTADEEVGADVYSAATKREQAKIVFGDARAMMIKRADFASKLGVVVNLAALTQPKSNSKFEPLSRDYGTMDGLNIHIALIDELHAHKDRGIYDVIETGAAKRLNSLLWAITTAGVDTSGICYEQRTYVSRILNQAIEDESYFGIIYTIDEDDDWTDPKAWVKANPNWGVSVMPEVIGQLATKAMQTPSAQANFKTKHLDVWCQANNPAFDLEAWERCTDDSLVEEDFTLDPCVFGIDIATKTDIASFVRLYERDLPKYAPGCESHSVRGQWECKTCYPDESDKEKHYYLFATNWLPEAAVYDGRNSQYQGWALEGHLTETPGEVLDFSLVKQEILDRAALVVLKGACYDPWQMAAVAQDLEKDGLPMIEVRATVANFSAPMKELMALVISQRLHHPGSPAMKWMFSNVVGHFDVKDNIYPRKEKPENKIDAAVATIMALYHMLLQQSGPYTADRGLLTL
jgi:phage terminase large subunit-like protein